MKKANWVKGRAQVIPPRLSLRPGCVTKIEPDVLGRMLAKGYRHNASMLAKIEHMEVCAGIRVPTEQTPVDLGDAWESSPRPDRKPIRGDLPVTGLTPWAAAYPRDRHNPKRGCTPGSEDQDTSTCDACHGEDREGFVCLRCLPGGAARAKDREKAARQMLAKEERAASRRRHGKRQFVVRSGLARVGADSTDRD